MAAGLWQVGLWREGGHAPFSHGQFRSVFSVKLFVELNRPRPDFISILAPADASSADLDWMNAELSRAGSVLGALYASTGVATTDFSPSSSAQPALATASTRTTSITTSSAASG